VREGLVALVFSLSAATQCSHPHSFPSVWFRDLSSKLQYLAASASAFLRLSIVHAGLSRWQFAFTPHGLDPATVFWIRLLAPQWLWINAKSLAHTELDHLPGKLDLAETNSKLASFEASTCKLQTDEQATLLPRNRTCDYSHEML